MRDIRHDIARWFGEGSKVALAQVTKTWGSSPRAPGSVMAISSSGQIAGSVSGGCIEGAVIQIALECLNTGHARMEKYHATTRKARELGLSCGGNVEVLISEINRELFETENHLQEADCEYMRVTISDATRRELVGNTFLVTAGTRDEGVPHQASCLLSSALAAKLWSMPRSSSAGLFVDEGVEYFYSREMPKPMLVCIGGVHIAIHLTQIAKALGYRTIVIDPRRIFSTTERFPFVDELIHEWPQQAFKRIPLNAASAVCALTHDPKIDVPALAIALESDAFYIGSLGRYTTQLSRSTQLREMGYGDKDISRIYGPIGLDLASKDPSEIALSIIAEMTAVRNGSALRTSTMLSSAHRAQNETPRAFASEQSETQASA